MIVCLDLPDTTCMISATFITECPTRHEDQDYSVIQALLNPHEVMDYKLEYEWDDNKIVRTRISENGKVVSDKMEELERK